MDTKKRKKNGYEKNVYQSLALISQFGINMVVPIVMCSIVGMLLDHRMGTSYWMVVLFPVGALAGFRNIYLFAKRVYEQKPDSKRGRVSEEICRSVSGAARKSKTENKGQDHD